MDELAIRVEDVSKVYRLYNRPSERLVGALGRAGKGRHHAADSRNIGHSTMSRSM